MTGQIMDLALEGGTTYILKAKSVCRGVRSIECEGRSTYNLEVESEQGGVRLPTQSGRKYAHPRDREQMQRSQTMVARL